MKKLFILFLLLGLVPTAFARKIGCGVKAVDDFKLNKQIIVGKQYKKERTMSGNVEQEFKLTPIGQAAVYSVRYEIERYQVRVIIVELSTGNYQAYELGSISPKDAVYGQNFSEEFKIEIEPIHFKDENGKSQVIKEISGKCKMEKFSISDLLPIP